MYTVQIEQFPKKMLFDIKSFEMKYFKMPRKP